MSDKNNLYSPTHFSLPSSLSSCSSVGCVCRVMMSCGTSKNNAKEGDESSTMNNCSVTHILQQHQQHPNVHIQNEKKKHHNFDQASESTLSSSSWWNTFLCNGTAKIKILFLFFTALLSTCIRLQIQHCHFFSRTQKFNYKR